MEKLIVEGGRRLSGEVSVSGAKNAVLPIMAASLLTDDACIIRHVPRLRDVQTMVKLLESLGKKVAFEGSMLTITAGERPREIADYDLVSRMRGSFCVLGPLLAKLKKAYVSLPGGCVIGIRPVDLHLKGMQLLGAKIDIKNGYVIAQTGGLKGTYIYLGGVFGPSVLATANVMMAATLAEGKTVIESAACEPEIEDLANFLIGMGAKVIGHGSPRIVVEGIERLHGVHYTVIPDRIEAGTFLLAAAATKGSITVTGAKHHHLMALIDAFNGAGITVDYTEDSITIKTPRVLKPVSFAIYPYPGFPTDLQAQFMALMAVTQGVSVITDKVFPDRFIHIAELNRMGANIRREGNNAIIQGVRTLYGAPVMVSDLRASAALVIAGLAAEGKTEIHRIYHLERGYEAFDDKLSNLGAMIYREQA